MDHLLNKPYVNGVSLGEQNVYLKCYQTLEKKRGQRQGQDLSKEALYISVGQRAANLQAIKIGGLKKNSAAKSELNHSREGYRVEVRAEES